MARKILLADDSVTAQNMGRKILTDAGYEVVTVNNGSAALKKVAEHKPDLIVLDVYMPGYSGLEVCQRIKENKETSRIPILLTVGKLEPFKPEEARRARADAFVVKPFEASELLTALTKLEEKVVPQAEPYKQGRFARAMAAVDSETESGEKFGDKDGGWKARLRFPTGSRKSEPDIDYASTQGKGVRGDDIEDSDKKQKSKSAESQFERPIPAGLPHDITPEEIAAITAAAAQLSGTAQPHPPTSEAPSRPSTDEAPAAEPAAEESAPVTFASSPVLQQPEVQAESEPVGLATPSTPIAPEAEVVQPVPAVEAASIDVPVATTEVAKSEETFPVEQSTYEASQVSTDPSENVQPPVVEPVMEAASPEVPVIEASSPEPPAGNATQSPESKTEPEPTSVPTAAADDELMSALQSLMPVADNAAQPSSAQKVDDLPPALAAIVAEVDSRMLVAHPAGPRWIAEQVALAASEATLSLQREMEQAYAAFAAADGFHAPSMQATASAVAVADGAPAPLTEQVSAAVKEAPAVLAMAAAAAETGTAVAAVQSPTEEVPLIAEPVPQAQPEETHERVKPAENTLEAPAQYEAEAIAESSPVPMTSSDAAPASTETEIVGGTEDMAANWKNIRDSIAGAAAKPAVAKEETRELEPTHAQGTAAPEATGSGATDPKAIANIVDTVLAELRPKIVEEIAKKLADPKKS